MRLTSSTPRHSAGRQRYVRLIAAASVSAATLQMMLVPTAVAAPFVPVASPRYIPTTSYDGLGSQQEMAPSRPINNAGISVATSTAYIEQGSLQLPIIWGRAARWSNDGATSILMQSLLPMASDLSMDKVYEINDAGISVGSATRWNANAENLGSRAVRWDASGQITELNSLGTDASGKTNSYAPAINSAGTAVGFAEEFVNGVSVGMRPVRWEAGGVAATRLGDLGANMNNGDNYVAAEAINEAGDAIGMTRYYVNNVAQGTRALRWDAGQTVPVVLQQIETYGNSGARVSAINSSRVVVGSSSVRNMSGKSLGSRALRWNADAQVTLLGGLGTRADGYSGYTAYDLNDAGVAVGYATKYVDGVDRGGRAVRWDPDSSTAVELPNFGTASSGFATGAAVDINQLGTIVGRSYDPVQMHSVPTIWLPGSSAALNVSTLVDPSHWELYTINAVSDTGFIACIGAENVPGKGWTPMILSMLIPEAGTYGRGDANFDTHVNFDDLLILAQHYGESNANQNIHVADLDLDGIVDFGDLLALAQHYESGAMIDPSSLGSTFSADWALARSMVPEPVSVLNIGMLGILRRTRRG